MAVGKMKKLSVVTMRSETDKLMMELQKRRCVDLSASVPESTVPNTPSMHAEESALLQKKLRDARQAIDFLSQYHKKTRSLFTPMTTVSFSADTHETAETESAISRAVALEDRLRRIAGELMAMENEQLALYPWRGYTEVLPVTETYFTKTVCGTLPGGVEPNGLDTMLGAYSCVIEIVSADKTSSAIAVTAHKDDLDAVLRTLAGYGFTQTSASASAVEGFADGKLSLLRMEQTRLASERKEIRQDAESLAEKLSAIEVYCDRLTTKLARLDASGQLTYTDTTAVLTGWVPEKEAQKLVTLLEERGDAYEFTDPEPEDDVPVLLENNAMATQFEPVISLYSLPAYGTFDPTFVMSFFYIIIFGLMFADVGYGALLVAVCLLGLKLMKPTGSLRKFMQMFTMCGGSMIVMGILFGGYFGDLPDAIAKYFLGKPEGCDLALWFNPLSEPMMFLFVSIGIGALHLFAGLCVKFYVLWKSGHPFAAIFDAGSWMLVFIGAVGAFLSMHVGIAVVCTGLVMLVLTQGRAEKNPIMKVLKGLLSLYDIVGYVSDILSYSRILSLGLASAVIASVFNTIGTLFGPTVAGVIMLIIVGTIGHVMNLGINLLGSFVHTSRLQYIEFFGKFYEDGGRPFTPLSPHSQFVRFE